MPHIQATLKLEDGNDPFLPLSWLVLTMLWSFKFRRDHHKTT